MNHQYNNSPNKIKVSLIVPFYNVEKYFEDCLKSLTNQDMNDIEIILVDDCSPDNSLAIAQRYAKKDNRIKIIRHEENKKQGGARNTGLIHALGEYVWFIDSDDYLVDDSSIVSNLYKKANSINADWLMFDIYRNIKGKLNYKSSIKNSSQLTNNIYILEGLSIVNFLINHNLNIAVFRYFFKRSFLQKNKCIFPENTTSEDYVSPFWMIKSEVMAYIPIAYYVFCKRKNSTTTSKVKKYQYKDNITMILFIENLIDIKNWSHVYLGVRLLFSLFLYQHPLIKEFNMSKSNHKQQIVEDMARTLKKISYVFSSQYFDEAMIFGNINFPKKYSKEDLKKLIKALKDGSNQNNLKDILYESYLKLYESEKKINIVKNILREVFLLK